MNLEFDEINLRIFLTTRRNMAIALVMAAVGVLLVLFAVIPQAQQAYELYQQLESEKPKLAKLRSKMNELQNLVYRPEYAQINSVNATLPSKKPLLELLTGLSAVTNQTRVSINSFDLSPGLIATEGALQTMASAGPYDKLSLELTLAGTFESIQEFMVQLERISPFTTIISLELSDPKESLDPAVPTFQEATMVTETYYFTQPISVTVDAPIPQVTQKQQEVLGYIKEFSVTEVPQQTEVRGGGRDDLFGIEGLF